MSDKFWGIISMLVGAFGIFRSYQLFQHGIRGGTPWLLILAGVVLFVMGAWRFRRKPEDPAAELMK
jgi:hypothetical protein